MTTLYTAHATSTHGREGHASTDDKLIDLDLATPGGNKKGSNPEQLFACGYAACFGSAVEYVAKLKKLSAGDVTVKSDVSLNKDEGGFSIAVKLNVSIAGLDAKTTREVVTEAHKVCPYSKATRGNIQVELQVDGETLAKAA
ncbi:MAG: organic hydroperoxide resistance protein [Alphaproteobacteria bacterium]